VQRVRIAEQIYEIRRHGGRLGRCRGNPRRIGLGPHAGAQAPRIHGVHPHVRDFAKFVSQRLLMPSVANLDAA